MSAAQLDLSATIERTRPLRAESIRVDVVLRNAGTQPVEVPHLGMNNGALALVVRDDGGKEIGAYTWADALRRLEELKFDPNQAQLQELRPGETDVLTRDLMLVRDPLEPGTYTVSARLRHGALAIESAPVAIEVLPTFPHNLCFAADGDVLGPWHLYTAWVDTIDGRPWIVQGATFDTGPGVMHHVDRAFALNAPPHADGLRLSRPAGPQADHRATLLRRDEGVLRWSTLGPAATPREHEVAIGRGESWCGTPWRKGTSTFVLLTNGEAPEARCLRLDDDGTSTMIGTARTPSTKWRELVLDSSGRPWCLALANEGTGSALWQCGFDASPPTERLRARTHAVALCVSHARVPIAALVLEDDDPKWMVTWALRGDSLSEKVQGARWPRAKSGESWSFAIGVHGGLHGLLQRANGTALYGDPFAEVGEHTKLNDLKGTLHLLAGRRGEPYVAAVREGVGVVMRGLSGAGVAGVAGTHVH